MERRVVERCEERRVAWEGGGVREGEIYREIEIEIKRETDGRHKILVELFISI